MNDKIKKTIQGLAQEGKPISKIMEKDFPDLGYWEIYDAVYSAGGKSALGVKRSVANRIKTLENSNSKNERARVIKEIDELVWHLYNSLKASQKKLEIIRKALDK